MDWLGTDIRDNSPAIVPALISVGATCCFKRSRRKKMHVIWRGRTLVYRDQHVTLVQQRLLSQIQPVLGMATTNPTCFHHGFGVRVRQFFLYPVALQVLFSGELIAMVIKSYSLPPPLCGIVDQSLYTHSRMLTKNGLGEAKTQSIWKFCRPSWMLFTVDVISCHGHGCWPADLLQHFYKSDRWTDLSFVERSDLITLFQS